MANNGWTAPGKGHMATGKPFVHALPDSPVVVSQGKNLFHFVQHFSDADTV